MQIALDVTRGQEGLPGTRGDIRGSTRGTSRHSSDNGLLCAA